MTKKWRSFHLIGFVRKSHIVGAFLSLAVVEGAAGQSVPKLNVDPVCRGIAQQAFSPSEAGGPDLAYRQCVRSETAMRRRLVAEWRTFSPSERTNCIGSELGGMASYTDLVTCLEMSRAARTLNQ
jgi:hypothetical protein